MTPVDSLIEQIRAGKTRAVAQGITLVTRGEDLIEATKLVVRESGLPSAYIRPIAYKSSEIVGVRMHGIEDDHAVGHGLHQ